MARTSERTLDRKPRISPISLRTKIGSGQKGEQEELCVTECWEISQIQVYEVKVIVVRGRAGEGVVSKHQGVLLPGLSFAPQSGRDP
jgi:hypothetical protein